MSTATLHASSDGISRVRILMRVKVCALQFSILILLSSAASFAATPVDFYATVSSSQDTNMITMTTDLFFTQFQALDGYTVNDKRTQTYEAGASSQGIAFYAEIQECGDGGWSCTLNAVNAASGKAVNETKKYVSYYKILLDAKSSLETLLNNLYGKSSADQPAVTYSSTPEKSSNATVSFDSLAGTWSGESLIDKIIILRGGRGFIIFKNGASMNITISLEGNAVKVKQSGKSNASYFPDLPRDVALKNASTAQPISWDLTISSTNKLTGTKTTLIEDGGSDSGVTTGSISVEWDKISK